ncbi:MAG: acyltransferase [Clostridia bacterium]|nr:acyltransferase [Clostridia bacterium]
MSKLLEKRNSIYGACALWVILFHTQRRIPTPYIPVISNIIGIGNIAVDIFFFFSGLCLSLSASKHDYANSGWGNYFKRRFTRVLLPYLIICIPFYLWAAAFESSGSFAARAAAFFANISSVSFWLKGTQTTWFVYGILVFYIVFPLIYTFVKNRGIVQSGCLLLGFVLFAVLTAYLPILNNSMIVWARLPIFTIGVISGTEYFGKIKPTKPSLIIAAAVAVPLGWLTSVSELSETFTIPQVYRWLLYIPITLSLMLLLSQFGKKIKILEWVGGLSLEVYLIHVTMLHPLKHYGVMDAVGYWLYIILPAAALLSAAVVWMIEKWLLKQGVRA